ncbi:MAG: hypothetical protein DI547_00875 [Sphingobium sp.]|nr:MAG: hypothetical protein DI547_00875 [Sphingobium sp.]
MGDAHAPLIVTATMGKADFMWADGQRRACFPPERNHVPAHITLFHHLPPSVLPELLERLSRICAEPCPPARLTGVISLGRGVAYRVESAGLAAIRGELAEASHGLLVPQDAVPPRLHITIQNKVEPGEASVLYATLARTFRPRPLAIAGIAVWRYLDGPWEAVREMRFRR